MASPVDVDENRLDGFLGDNPVAVIDFWGVSCMPCKVMDPLIDQLAEEYSGRCAFGKFRVDGKWKLVGRRYNVMSVPTLLVYKDGKNVKRMTGYSPRSTIKTLRDTIEALV
ncbi:thioredoxin [Candidatus Bathyarchaeota archaeon]|nr:thioredoxin [Candidatus Bathyarchaeota archaeon]